MAQQRDEVGPTGIYPPGVPAPPDAKVITPGEINQGPSGRSERKRRSPERRPERLPRKGDELDDLHGISTD